MHANPREPGAPVERRGADTSVTPDILRKRADFLAAARAARAATPSLVLQARQRGDDDPALRVGYTCSRKVGNAVARNRAKRRLREAARAILSTRGRPGWDYVLIGRRDATATRPFALLCKDLADAVESLHARGPAATPGNGVKAGRGTGRKDAP